MSPDISVITPVKARNEREREWLGYTIQSVLDQTFDNWEMVIVDDASPMNLEAIVNAYPDPRIRWYQGGNGCVASRNWAAECANSSLLLPVDADDKLARNAMALFMEEWKLGGEEAGFVYSDVMVFGQDFSRLISAPEYDFDHLLQSTYIAVGALHRKSDWERIGGWRPEMEGGLEDWDYWITAGELGICGWRMPQPLYWYRRHPASRLSRLRARDGGWGTAYARLRDRHRAVYAGRKPMGCCGGSRRGRAARQTARGVLEPEIQGPTVLMEYVGRREGSFWVKGSISGIRYRIPGSAARFKIDSRDYQYIASMPSIRKVKEQPRTTKRAEPPAEDVMLKASKESFSPTKMEEKIVKPEVPDPSKLTIPYLRSADFNVTPGVAAQMIELEKKGKNRRTAIAALKRKL